MLMNNGFKEGFVMFQTADVKKFGFRTCGLSSILSSPKGGGVVREGWVHSTETYRESPAMTFTFKLSRRLARLRVLPLLAALLVVLSCSGEDLNEPSTPVPAPDLTAVTIHPDSAAVTVNGSTKFEADPTIAEGSIAASKWRWVRLYRPARVDVAPASSTLRTGAKQAFRAAAASASGTTLLSRLTWSATGGQVDGAGTYTAGNRAGTFAVIVTTSSGLSDTAVVTITETAPPPSSGVSQVVLSPVNGTVEAGGSLNFRAEGKAADGTLLDITATFTTTGGSITSSGKYTAPSSAGTYSVVATDPSSGKADTSDVAVTVDAPVLAQVVLSPGSASVVAGTTKQFSTVGKASDGSAISITPSYTATGGTISSSGLYTAGTTAGTFRIIAAASGKVDTATVTVTTAPSVPTLERLVLTPASASLNSGATATFAAKGVMSNGADTPVTVTFTATGGSITSNGTYTAGPTSGSYKVIAKLNGGTLADTSSINVTALNPAPDPDPNPGPTPTPPPSSSGCNAGDRAVNVSSATELKSALGAAQPGDCITMAAGNYNTGQVVISRSGTSSQRITLTGPRGAIMTGFLNPKANYWTFEGFTVTGGLWGIYSDPGSWNVFDGLEIHHTQQEAIHLHLASKHNVVSNNYVHHTGTVRPEVGECVYLGSGADGLSGTNPADSNQVLNNLLTDCGAEGVDVKEGTTGNLIQGNTITNVGLAKSIGSDAGIAIRGSGARVYDNTITGTPRYSMQVWPEVGWGNNNVLRGNKMSGIPSGYYGIQVRAGYESGTTITCDNTVTGAQLSNIACK
jgi:Right handed beta helix region